MSTERHTSVKGAGLARGPALLVGLVLAVFGLILFFNASGTPLSTTGFPDAQVQGERFIGFEANAWTAWLTAAAGVILLFGAAQHLAAKTASLLVGLALGAAAAIALVDGDVLGLAAANGLTALGWGIAAAILLINTLMPRVRHEETVHDTDRGVQDVHDRDDDVRAEREREHEVRDGDAHVRELRERDGAGSAAPGTDRDSDTKSEAEDHRSGTPHTRSEDRDTALTEVRSGERATTSSQSAPPRER